MDYSNKVSTTHLDTVVKYTQSKLTLFKSSQRLGSFLDQLAFVHKNKAQVFLLGLIDVFNKVENELDFKVNAQAHKMMQIFLVSSKE